jgi:hypothetical protein
MASIKEDFGALNNSDTITLTDHPSYSTVDYGAIPTITTTDMSTLTVGKISFNNNVTGIGGYTIGGLNGATGSNTVWTTNTIGAGSYRLNDPAAVLTASGQMELKGDGADLTINGKSLKDWMERVEERLNILTPNPELEKEWDDLRRLGERYRKLEKKCQEKAEMWSKLKSLPKIKQQKW